MLKICENCTYILTVTTKEGLFWYECFLLYPVCSEVKLTDTCKNWKEYKGMMEDE